MRSFDLANRSHTSPERFFSTSSHAGDEGAAALSSDKNSSAHKRKPRALVVDDAIDIAFMFAIMLQQVGLEAVTADSASSALDVAQREHFDIVISDIGMPGMNGYELARALRNLPEYKSIPMVAVTGFTQYDDCNAALDAGFNTHFSKPVDPAKLTALVSSLLQAEP